MTLIIVKILKKKKKKKIDNLHNPNTYIQGVFIVYNRRFKIIEEKQEFQEYYMIHDMLQKWRRNLRNF